MLRRSRLPDTDPSPALLAPELEVVDVTRLECLLDTGLPLSFDLEADKDHSYKHDAKWLTITLGPRVIRIAAHRILYTETRPAQLKRVIAPA